MQRHRPRTQALLDVFHAHVEVGARLIHFVGEDDARNLVLVALAPNGFGLRFNALVAVEHDDGAVEHAQRTFDFDREVDVAGRVDDVQALLLPERRRRRRRNGDAALLLLFHPVHGGRAIVDFADLVALAAVEQNALSRRRLTRIDVSHDAEVAIVFDFVLTRHDNSVRMFDRPALFAKPG